MTVVIGFKDLVNKRVYMGADRCASNCMTKFSLEGSKIYQPVENKNFLLGFSGDPRVMQLINSYFRFPDEKELEATLKDEEFGIKYIVRFIIPSIQEILKIHVYSGGTVPLGTMGNSSLLIAYKDKLFVINGNFQVIETSEPYASIGGGCFAANAVMEAIKDQKNTSIITKMIHALKISSKLSIGVEGPYDMYLTGQGKLSDSAMEELVNNKPEPPIVIKAISKKYWKSLDTEHPMSISDFMTIFQNVNDDDLKEEYFAFKSINNDLLYIIDRKGQLCSLDVNGTVTINVEVTEDILNDQYILAELNKNAKMLLASIKEINGIDLEFIAEKERLEKEKEEAEKKEQEKKEKRAKQNEARKLKREAAKKEKLEKEKEEDNKEEEKVEVKEKNKKTSKAKKQSSKQE